MAAQPISEKVKQAIEVYTKGTKAWFEDEQEAWVSASVVSNEITDTNVKIVFENDDDGSREHVFESSLAKLEKSQGAEGMPPLRNPPNMENTDDLTNLSYLNEPSVLSTIRTRYMQHDIYTYSGIVLIAMNPFARVQLYEPDIIQRYSGRRRGELEPHLFAIAEDAYRCMIREKTNQTVVVSGESGAGKTVSAKFVMRYFAMADDNETVGKVVKAKGDQMTEVEEQIIATNPILEAFGNAKTTRNDNSSRFGKYMEIQFDQGSNIVGARIRTYLLERSRLVFQPETERNYHIFYQMCAGIPVSERKEFDLGDWAKFRYLNQGGTGTVPGVNDAQEFEDTKKALSQVGISLQTQWQVFRLLAALLHLGNIEIGGRNDATLADNEPSLLTVTKLLGIKTSEFRKWIVRKQIVTRNDKIVSNLNPAQAHVVRDSVAKYIYANLFDWLVKVVNDSLSCQDEESVKTFIGVLDIYGFEHFKKNSFEQFCINYANEKLQQQFNQHVFKLEQEEYVKEKIDWKFIDFSDNQGCIEMIEARMGILSLLDEESRLPSGTDQGFCDKLIANFSAPQYKNYFQKPRFSNSAFTVMHYAHPVQYEAEGFLDKNKDTVPDEHLALLQSSDSEFLVEMLATATAAANAVSAAAPPPTAGARRSTTPKKPSLGSIFKQSLISLMETIGQTNVHYIRCIKPNEAKVAWAFDPNMVLSQLRACGVLETIHISCAGYPTRWTYEDFADRYYLLVSSEYWDPNKSPDIKRICNAILDATITDKDKYQIGLSKIFFRAGQLAYMEKLRSDRWNDCVVLLQKNMRRFITRIHYMRTKDLADRLQRIARKKVAIRQLEELKKNRAALVLQKYCRGYFAKKEMEKRRTFVIHLQAACRAVVARKAFGSFRENNAATQIQRLFRGWIARKKFLDKRQHIIAVQACIRRRQGRKLLIGLRQEARSASHLKEVSYKLENTVVELTQTLTHEKEQKKMFEHQTRQLEMQVQTWSEKYGKLEVKLRSVEEQLVHYQNTDAELATIRETNQKLQQDYNATVAKSEEQEKDIAKLSAEVNKLRQQPPLKVTTSLNNGGRSADEAEIAELKSQIAALKAQLAQSFRNTPRRQGSLTSYGRNLSPVAMSPAAISPSGARRGYSPDRGASPRGRSPTGSNMSFRRNSFGDTKKSKLTDDSNTIIYNEPEQIRPMSIDHVNALRDAETKGNPEEVVHSILRNRQELNKEIVEGLILSRKIIWPDAPNPPSHKEVVFPAHIIGLTMTQMWRYGYLGESEQLFFSVLQNIQEYCSRFSGDDTIVPCAYWLSNTHELLSIVCSTEQDLEREMHFNTVHGRRAVGWHDFEKLVSIVKYELQCSEDELYHHWLKELKTKCSKIIVAALIEHQSLPGYYVSENTRFFNKFLANSKPAFSLDDLLNFLNRIYNTMKNYDVDPLIVEQTFSELLKLIGTVAFNDLLMRRNYNSWKRAMQIQYNLTRLEEWCKSHGMTDSIVHLEHLMQGVKLFQLRKATPNDIGIIYEACWLLTPAQVQKLLQSYQVADYEEPLSNNTMREVASRVSSNDLLQLETVPLEESPFEDPAPKDDLVANTYVPAYLNLKQVQKLMTLVPLVNKMRSMAQDSL